MTGTSDTARPADDRLAALAGREGVSPWRVIDQATVDQYAVISGDGEGEWVHLDPERAAREAPYGGTIVPGFLQVANLTRLFGEAVEGIGGIDVNHALNYGFDRLRFVTPLPVGAAFRARVKVTDIRPHPAGGYVVKQNVSLEKTDGALTLAAEWLFYVSEAASQGAQHDRAQVE